ncbi:MAG: threonylcarbamoyl-AMP synthase [Acidobacteriaceae bacterium]|nr:threonylcarbamoyl-AMP synthase [Acidobacteriaceae bacterium]MBV9780379.1 threonylcarbamoyl-AMP synthase [Acidobacteriaceae bacterium]
MNEPSEEELARAADLIRSGGLVAFPTETVYGLGANALDANAVRRTYEAKGRPASSPLIVHVANEGMAKSITAEWPQIAQTLARRFWPGPLTLVLKKSQAIPDLVTAGLDSVGVRVPAHPVALELIRRAAVPIAAPSANRFTEVSPTTAEHVRVGLGNRVDMILDGGSTQVGIESTVVALTRDPPAVLRPGMISKPELEAATGRVWSTDTAPQNRSASPGLHPRHYAPRTPLYILERGERPTSGTGYVIPMPTDPPAYATALYAKLHEADAGGWDWIAVEKPPDTPNWAGILDRLRRASTQRS